MSDSDRDATRRRFFQGAKDEHETLAKFFEVTYSIAYPDIAGSTLDTLFEVGFRRWHLARKEEPPKNIEELRKLAHRYGLIEPLTDTQLLADLPAILAATLRERTLLE